MINCNVCVYVYMGNAHLYLMLSFIVSIIIILHSSIGYKNYSNASWCRAQLGLIKSATFRCCYQYWHFNG